MNEQCLAIDYFKNTHFYLYFFFFAHFETSLLHEFSYHLQLVFWENLLMNPKFHLVDDGLNMIIGFTGRVKFTEGV